MFWVSYRVIFENRKDGGGDDYNNVNDGEENEKYMEMDVEPFNVKATFVQSMRTQSFLKTI